MKEQVENIKKDTQDLVYDELVSMYDYWGINSLIEMIDFCFRNQLHLHKNILTTLLKSDRIRLTD